MVPKWTHLRHTAILVLYYALLRHLPRSYSLGGSASRRMRNAACRILFDSCDSSANIERGCTFGRGAGVRVGSRSSIGIDSEIHGPVWIGKNVMMAPEVIIHTENHKHDRTDLPMIDQGYSPKRPVVIGDDVWIGARVIILPGVSIGDGAIIGAGSVVSRSVPSFSIAVGNPCKVVRQRA